MAQMVSVGIMVQQGLLDSQVHQTPYCPSPSCHSELHAVPVCHRSKAESMWMQDWLEPQARLERQEIQVDFLLVTP